MFEELGYHAAHATVYAFNQRSQRFHEAMGFTAGGRLRESHFSGGRFHDELIQTMTAREFSGPVRRHLLSGEIFTVASRVIAHLF